jgi:RNA polymerase sigma-70 factor (ECF subfamily)
VTKAQALWPAPSSFGLLFWPVRTAWVIRRGGRCRMECVERDLAADGDAQLVVAVGRYDEAAMGELYRRYGPAVYGLARRVIGDASMAEEVLQDVFVRLWREPTRFDPARADLRAFLLRETRSRAIDRVRTNEARLRREDRHGRRDVRGGDDLERQVWEMVRSEKVKEAMAALLPGERQAITMAYFEGYTYREVASLLDEPEGTIKSRIRLGLRRLADALDHAGLGAQP